MSILKKLNEEIKLWDKCEGAGAIFWMYGWGKKKNLKDVDKVKSEDLTIDQAYKAMRNKTPVQKWDGKIGIITNIRENYYRGIAVVEIKYPHGAYGAELISDLKIADVNEDEDDDYRDDTQGHRNAKYLMKARIHADTPKARLKRQRTELRKDLNIQS